MSMMGAVAIGIKNNQNVLVCPLHSYLRLNVRPSL